jgi:hypothetical protein
MINLFDLTKKIFEDPVGYKEISKGDKRKNFFMVNRRFAIGHPIQAGLLNHIRVNQSAVIDVWQGFMRKTYNKTPFWMFIKGIKKTKEQKESKRNISSESIREYARINRMDLKSINDALEMFPDKMTKEIKDFEKIRK